MDRSSTRSTRPPSGNQHAARVDRCGHLRRLPGISGASKGWFCLPPIALAELPKQQTILAPSSAERPEDSAANTIVSRVSAAQPRSMWSFAARRSLSHRDHRCPTTGRRWKTVMQQHQLIDPLLPPRARCAARCWRRPDHRRCRRWSRSSGAISVRQSSNTGPEQ